MDAPKYRGRKAKHEARRHHQRQQRQRKMDALNHAATNSRLNKTNGQPNAADFKKHMEKQGYLPTGKDPFTPAGWQRTVKLDSRAPVNKRG